MKFLLGQRFFNNIFCATWIIPYPRKLNKRKKIKLNKLKILSKKIKYPVWYNNNY